MASEIGRITESRVTANFRRLKDIPVPVNANQLTKLFLGHNKISSLSPLQYYPSLTTLHLEHNEILELDELNHASNKLVELGLTGNSWTLHPDYLDRIMTLFKNLRELDGWPIGKQPSFRVQVQDQKIVWNIFYSNEQRLINTHQRLKRARIETEMAALGFLLAVKPMYKPLQPTVQTIPEANSTLNEILEAWPSIIPQIYTCNQESQNFFLADMLTKLYELGSSDLYNYLKATTGTRSLKSHANWFFNQAGGGIPLYPNNLKYMKALIQVLRCQLTTMTALEDEINQHREETSIRTSVESMNPIPTQASWESWVTQTNRLSTSPNKHNLSMRPAPLRLDGVGLDGSEYTFRVNIGFSTLRNNQLRNVITGRFWKIWKLSSVKTTKLTKKTLSSLRRALCKR